MVFWRRTMRRRARANKLAPELPSRGASHGLELRGGQRSFVSPSDALMSRFAGCCHVHGLTRRVGGARRKSFLLMLSAQSGLALAERCAPYATCGGAAAPRRIASHRRILLYASRRVLPAVRNAEFVPRKARGRHLTGKSQSR